MGLTIETTHNAKKSSIMVHCETCPKMIDIFKEGLQAMTDEDILLYTGYAELHLKKHPKHKVTMYVRERTPTNQEIRG